MNFLNTLKKFVGLAPKPEGTQTQTPVERVIDLPNGRQAVVDGRGNFVRFVGR